MTAEEVRALLRQAGEEITDDQGRVIGYVRVPARFKVNRPYLAGGGFLIVERDEETGAYVGIEFDALWDKKRRRYYPAGYSERVFTAPDLESAVQAVLAYLAEDPPAGDPRGGGGTAGAP